MKRAFQISLCLLTALHLCGGHLGVLQLVAWAKMIREYSAQKGIVAGVKETFDGEHPCAICCKIKKAKQDERNQTPLPLVKFEDASKWLGLLPEMKLPEPGWLFSEDKLVFAAPMNAPGQWNASPPTPPPRSAV